MDWNDLRYFLAVARAGTLAGSARVLGVEHTTVGRRLAALENSLGVRLFTRGPTGLVPTEAGNEILLSVNAIAEHVDSIERRISGQDGRVAGTVRVTVPETGRWYFEAGLSTLSERFPEIVLELLSDDRALDVRRGEADIAVRFRDNPDPDLVVRRAGLAAWSLYASQEYVARKGPLKKPDELEGHDVIGFDSMLNETEGALWLRAHSRGANVVLRGSTVSAVASAAAAGFGLAALPCFSASREPKLIRLTEGRIGERDILLVTHPELARVPRVRVAMDYLIELFTRDAKLWSGELA